ncbi:hypothetical protein [Candidatus Contendibacter odensensis]|jgi:hypothetical protein|uniref:Uncharacterized protein n=1 Tax=Candidatus Contendobacter odensis Run_B_J11 TaxID=1400861 RepID=A0A7U7J2Y7_9GAMM|nr:hypothetical protein [Candidatus Contendobacter odensis]CDH43792.1 hypothetical protein BN874_1320010 [Candidatus Contendobacter odensis Run_B_J11]
MDSLRLGMLLPGGRPVGDGINHAQRAPVLTRQGEVMAIVKELPLYELITEILCALLGRELNLPIPEPLLVIDPAQQLLVAGSVDVGYPSLHQPVLAAHLPLIAALLQGWPALVRSACFDEWIANPDRHGGNLLFDGQGFWLIDHGLALRVDPATVTVNHLMTTAIAARTDELARQRLKREVTQIYASYTDDLLLAAEQIIATADILNAAIPLNQGLHFLRRRWLALNSMTALRIRTTQGDLDYGH